MRLFYNFSLLLFFYALYNYLLGATSSIYFSLVLILYPITTIAGVVLLFHTSPHNRKQLIFTTLFSAGAVILVLTPNPEYVLMYMSKGIPPSRYLRYTSLQTSKQSLVTLLNAPPAEATKCSISVALAKPYTGQSRLAFTLNDTVTLSAQLDLNNPIAFSVAYTCSLFVNTNVISLSISQPIRDSNLTIAIIPLPPILTLTFPLPRVIFSSDEYFFEGAADPKTGAISKASLVVRHEIS